MTRLADPQINFADLEFLVQGVELDPILNRISDLLDHQLKIIERVRQDLQRGLKKPATGRPAMTSTQVLRSLILMRVKNWDFRELCERIADGYTLRRFTNFYSRRVPKHDAFNRAFNKLRPQTLQAINELVVKAAVELGVEDGKRLRVDTTVTETDVHHPTDNTLLWDVVRVLTRLVGRLAKIFPTAIDNFPNRTRCARRRMQELQRMTPRQRHTQQKRKYRQLIKITQQVLDNARAVLEKTKDQDTVGLMDDIAIGELRRKIDHYCQLAGRVIDQGRRRVLNGEQVPTQEKIYSIFEPHTNLIKRGKVQKPIEFGHKIFLAETTHGLITQYHVLEGNPADQIHVSPSLERHQQTFGLPPEWYSSDRGFFSNENIKACHNAAVKLVCIPQAGGKRTPQQQALEKSSAFKKGQRFRAGIEGRISVLFRGRGMKRCLVEGLERFEVMVGAAVLTNNLMTIAHLLNQKQKRFRRAAA
ncbi:MAG TPA: ISNCY family transposase [Gammaproteobacteria bacterium]|nr:ISNCY family transposase [Candidatus Binatia bacterium]HEX2244631.1 ISNCY family transposase [Gammaproteobacteria bacterium]